MQLTSQSYIWLQRYKQFYEVIRICCFFFQIFSIIRLIVLDHVTYLQLIKFLVHKYDAINQNESEVKKIKFYFLAFAIGVLFKL